MTINKYFRSIKNKDNKLFSYFFLATLRILLVFIPQLGYIHPDEYFQSMEVMAGDQFNYDVTRTWEFNATFPIRSITIPYICIKIPYNIIYILSIYSRYFLGVDLKSSYVLLVVPRFVVCLLSFLNDYSMYKICTNYGLNYEIRLLALASSYIMLVFGTRTFSNTIEMTLCSVLLYIVSECMIHSNTVIYQSEFLQDKYKEASTTVDKVRLFKMKSALPAHSFNKCLMLSTLCVIGVFNRPTFLIFGMPIVFFWLLRGLGSRSISMFDFNLRVSCFIITAIPSIIVFIIVDSLYYGYLSLSEIEHLDIGINNFVVTPLNFIRYNIDPSNTASHGVHPKYLHLLVTMPLLYNILGIIAIISFVHMFYRFCRKEYRYLPRAQSIVGLMTAAIFIPIAIFSLINHQEPRFLIPLTLPIILLHASTLQTGFTVPSLAKSENKIIKYIYKQFISSKISSKYLLKIWYTINIIMTLFFGFLHQGGVYQLGVHFSNVMQTKPNNYNIHLVTSHIYSLPTSLLLLPNTKILHTNQDNGQKYSKIKQFFLYEYGDNSMDKLYKKLKLILDVCEMKAKTNKQKYHLYLAIPSSLSEELNLAFYNSNSIIMEHKLTKVFYPHLSTEAMPKLFVQHPCEVNTDIYELNETCSAYDNDINNLTIANLLRQFSSIIHQFGLNLYKIEVWQRTTIIQSNKITM